MRHIKAPAPGGGFGSGGRTLIALPIVLASFALVLQLSNRQMEEQSSLYFHANGVGALSEQDYGGSLPEPRHAAKLQEAYRPGLAGGAGHSPGRAPIRTLRSQQQQQQQAQARPLGIDWRPQEPNPAGVKIAFVVTTSESLNQIRVWLAYHRAIGVSNFYIFVDGQAARSDVVAELRKLSGVRVIPRDDKLKKAHASSRIWNETWLSAFFHKPCNHELFVIQSLNMEVAIRMARADRVDWLLHIDTDELVYPAGSPGFSLQEVLAAVPGDVDTFIFPNYESLPEREDVVDPFTEYSTVRHQQFCGVSDSAALTDEVPVGSCPVLLNTIVSLPPPLLQVTLFKKNYHHVVSDLYYKNYHSISRGNPNYFITYGNGKSAARVQRGLRPNGAHRWHSYVKNPKEETSDQAAVLHFTYNRFGDLKSRRDRCDCAPTEEDAKRCFILPFDRIAFLEASLKSDEELMRWFRERLVWEEPGVVNDLLKKGLLARLYEPQIMVRGVLAAMSAAAIDVPHQQPPKKQQQQSQAQGGDLATPEHAGGTDQQAAGDPRGQQQQGVKQQGAAEGSQGMLSAQGDAGTALQQQQQSLQGRAATVLPADEQEAVSVRTGAAGQQQQQLGDS
ncbi:hypothetical protein N2152v2_010247 [Parachlorella kessleri]